MEFLKKKRSEFTSSHSSSMVRSKDGILSEKIAFEVSNNRLIYKITSDSEPSTSETKNSPDKEVPNDPGVNRDLLRNSRDTQTDTGLLYDTTVAFINTFLIRAFEDFFTHQQWIERIQNKIQNKLSMIRVPHFMEELKITGLDLGTIVPIIKHSSEPWCDERGLWVHLEIDYSGGS